MWKPDSLLLIANAIAELINSKPRSPSGERFKQSFMGATSRCMS